MDKKIVYVGGDSFAEGWDLVDEIIPWNVNYSTTEFKDLFYSKQIAKVAANWMKNREKFIYDNPELPWQRIQLENRWTTKLNELLSDHEVLNISSCGGSGNRAIMYRAIMDILNLVKSGKTIDKVILQLSSYPRFMHFYEGLNIPAEYIHNEYKIFNTVFTNYTKEQQELLYSTSLVSGQVYDNLWDIYTAEKTIESICGVRPIYVDSIWMHHYATNKSDPRCEYPELMDNWLESLDFNDPDVCENNAVKFFKSFSTELIEQLQLCSMTQCIADDEEKIWTGNFHLTKTIHERFANLIATTYFND